MSLTDNIISYWKLDGNSNDAVGSNNGTDTDITYSTGNGKINQGAGFNGTSSKIVGSAVNLATSLTINAWVKTTQAPTTDNPTMLGFFNGNIIVYLALRNTTHVARFLVVDSNGVLVGKNSSSAINDGNWHMITGVLTAGSPSTIELFVDGTSQGTATQTFTGNFNGAVMQMGYQSGAIQYFSGAVDECGYWARALSSTEITTLYNSGNGRQYPFPIVYTMTCTPATFNYTPQDSTETKKVNMITSPATFVFTGLDSSLKKIMNMICTPASYVFTGLSANLLKVISMICTPATYVYTGLSAGFNSLQQNVITRFTQYLALRKIK